MMKPVDQMVRIGALGLCVGRVWRAKIEQDGVPVAIRARMACAALQ